MRVIFCCTSDGQRDAQLQRQLATGAHAAPTAQPGSLGQEGEERVHLCCIKSWPESLYPEPIAAVIATLDDCIPLPLF